MHSPNINHIKISTARWDISPFCNLHCMHCCAEGLYKNLTPNHKGKNEAIAIIDQLNALGIRHLNILGKEPFLYPDFIGIAGYACDLGLQVDVTTNGTIIREELIPEIINLGIRSIFFSLDGSSPEVNDTVRGVGVFKRTVRTIKNFLTEKERYNVATMINVNTVLTKINCNDIYNIIELCADLGINLFKLSKLLDIGNVLKNKDKLSMTAQEEFAIAERVMQKISEYSDLSFDILTDKPLVLEYFYKRYKAVFPVRMSGCKACSKEIYINPVGVVFPCLGTSRDFPSTSSEDIKVKSVNILDIPDNRTFSEYLFQGFRNRFPLVPETYRAYKPCNSCPYLATLCFPCPLYAVNASYTEDFCMIAKQRLKELNTETTQILYPDAVKA